MTLDDLTISVVLPTYNRLARLQRVLAAFAGQTIPADQFELVVISDGSSDGTNEALSSIDTPFRLVPIFQENQGVAVARNNGVAQAHSDLILFVDDDVVPAPNLIAEHLQFLCQPEPCVVLGPMLTPPDVRLSPWVRWEQRMLEKQYHNMIQGRWMPTARQFYTGNTSLAKHYIVEAGGFDPSFRRAEDVELAFRLKDRGLKFVFNPNAIGYHYADRSYSSWMNIAYAYGRNDVIMTRQKGQDWLLPTVMAEFGSRNPLVRLLTHMCLGRPGLSQAAIYMMEQAAKIGDRLNIETMTRFSYSGIFNLRHYQGVADELGGADQFWEMLKNDGNL